MVPVMYQYHVWCGVMYQYQYGANSLCADPKISIPEYYLLYFPNYGSYHIAAIAF